MSLLFSQNRHFQSGFIPVCLAFCLTIISARVDAAVITSGSGISSADLLCNHPSPPELQGWNRVRAAVVKSTRGCLFVDLESMSRGLGARVSGLLLSFDSLGQRFLLDTSSSSGGGGGGCVGVLFFHGCEFAFSLGGCA